MKWYLETRANDEYTPPQIATILDGWENPKGDVASPIEKSSEVFIREVVQNFIDASRDARTSGSNSDVPKLTFRFFEFTGDAALEMAQRLDLTALSDHFKTIENPEGMRLPASDVLAGKYQKLSLLLVSERGTSGMYGRWDRSSEFRDASGNEIQHKMRDALLATVRGSAGKGLGSFGEGKKAVIGVSKCRTLFAYTCFDSNTTNDNASRRFMGGAYWQNHHSNNEQFSGFGMVGGVPSPGENRPRPFSNEEADAQVSAIGLPGFEVRNSADVTQFGTTLLFVEPNVEPSEVAIALARNWWPIIEDSKAEFEIIDAAGKVVDVNLPDEIKVFSDAYKVQESRTVLDWENADGVPAYDVSLVSSSLVPGENVGRLVLAVDLAPTVGFSRKDADKNTSIVALVRDGMLIAYQSVPKTGRMPAPFVRGVFVVDSTISPKSESALRRTEPPLHNKWKSQGSELDVNDRNLAKSVVDAIESRVLSFRDEHIATSAKMESSLPLFDERLNLDGRAQKVTPPPPPPPPKTAWSMLSNSASITDNGDGRRFAQASRELGLASTEVNPHKVQVEIGWEVLEDGTWKDAYETLIVGPISSPPGFERTDEAFNVFVGEVSAQPTLFSWSSAPYRELWTLRPYMKVTSLENGQEA
ncbi:MAG: hypothetical protein RL716_488 [Actinomycetota bacterium]|jgi:hypothetical protein